RRLLDADQARHPLCRRAHAASRPRARAIHVLLARDRRVGRRGLQRRAGSHCRSATTAPAGGEPMSAIAQSNPLREGLVEERLPEPCTIVIFGASGDLTKRKLMPALY